MKDAQKPSVAEPGNSASLSVLLLALTVTTGLVDAVSFLGLGQVFVALMTGNFIFLGFALGGTPNIEVASSVTAIASFMVGAILGGRIGRYYTGGSLRKWLLSVGLTESTLLIAAGIMALGFDIEKQNTAFQLFAVIILTAMAMGLRNATVTLMKVKDLKTTVLTLTLTGIGVDSSLAGGNNENFKWRVGSVIMLVIGAAMGAFLLYRSGGVSLPLFVCGLVVLGATLVFVVLPTGQTEGDAGAKVSNHR